MNESRISTILGGVVIVVVGLLIANYFKNLKMGSTTPTAVTSENSGVQSHTVVKGETLWSIAEKYYGDGFKWTEIAKTNEISKGGKIEVGQKLTIPEVKEAVAVSPSPSAKVVAKAPSASVAPTAAVSTPSATALLEKTEMQKSEKEKDTIAGTSYTVVKGDNLWTIAERAYGDGFKWTEIAKTNNLLNPRVIHAGNVFSIPR